MYDSAAQTMGDFMATLKSVGEKCCNRISEGNPGRMTHRVQEVGVGHLMQEGTNAVSKSLHSEPSKLG